MTSCAVLNQPQVRRIITILSLPGLIRLLSEIDDNGPVSRGRLQSTFGDLTRHQLRQAIDTAFDLGLVYCDGPAPARYWLTASGEDLADVYDTAARWARAHHFPGTISDFVTRVQRTLTLLGQLPGAECGGRCDETAGQPVQGGSCPTADSVSVLDCPRTALAEWIQAHPQAGPAAALRSSHAADDMERAA